MSRENVELFLRATELYTSGDVEGTLELVDPDVVWEPLRAAMQGAYHGHAGMRRFFADTAESFDSFRPEYAEVRDLGDGRVLALGRLHVRGKGSGIETDVPIAGIATFRDGRITRWKDHGDPQRALQAAGLEE
ncbi:MAG TPA: nuclear transport factor 2 family protein [Solirubrobacterales bacterium]|jgi:ketosteroid isomerase-like protein